LLFKVAIQRFDTTLKARSVVCGIKRLYNQILIICHLLTTR